VQVADLVKKTTIADVRGAAAMCPPAALQRMAQKRLPDFAIAIGVVCVQKR
jgi:hypothetical protein